MSFFNDVGKKVNQAAKVVGEKSGEFVEAGKTKVDIEKTQRELNMLYKDLGMKIYKNYKEGNVSEEIIEDYLKKIEVANTKLETLNRQQ